MEIGKTTWRVMLAVINAYNDGEYSHCSTNELREKFGLALKNQPEIFKKLIDEGWIKDCTINGYYKRFIILKKYPCPKFILDNRLNNPQKNLLLKCLELGINKSLSKKEMCRRLYNSENLSNLNTPFKKIENIIGVSVLDLIEQVEYVHNLIPENSIYTEHGYRSNSSKVPTEITSYENKVAKFLRKKSIGRFKHTPNIIEYNLTEEYLESLLIQQNYKDYYTGIVPENYKEYSLDRIDSSKGYMEGNIVITTNAINLMKGELTTEEFKNQIRLVYENLSNF